MQIVVKDLDETRIRFEAMMLQFGEKDAALAFSRALNHEGRKTFTAVKRSLRKQTSIPAGMIARAMKFEGTKKGHFRTIIEGRGSQLPLRLFGPKQFSYGVRAKVWGRHQSFKSAFIVGKLGGNVFHRTGDFGKMAKGKYKGRRREKIQRMFGPGIPQEMVKDETLDTFERSGNAVMDRAMHELQRILAMRG